MEIEWMIPQIQLPNDGELKLVSIRDGNYYYHEIARYNPIDLFWIYRDDTRLPQNLEVRAWANLLPIYTG